MSEYTIQLDHPMQIDGQSIHELTIRRPKVKDLREAEKAGAGASEQELSLFARLTGINPEDLDEMDLADYQKLQQRYSAFLS